MYIACTVQEMKYIQTVCNDSDFFKRRIIQRIAARELIESLQKKVRKGQVSSTSSLVYAYALHMPMPSSRAYPLLSAVYMYYSTYVSTARPVMYWAPNKQKRFMTNCSQNTVQLYILYATLYVLLPKRLMFVSTPYNIRILAKLYMNTGHNGVVSFLKKHATFYEISPQFLYQMEKQKPLPKSLKYRRLKM